MTNVTIKPKFLSTQLEHYASQLGEDDVMFFPPSEAKRLWQQFREAHGLQGAPKLLTHPEEQHKLGLSEAYTVGLTLQSADGSGFETCPWRGECASVCVLKNGNGRYNHVQEARNVKTQFLQEHPLAFLRLLVDEFDRLRRLQQEIVNRTDEWQDLRCRMNVNSDLRWYKIAPWLFARNDPWILFYDYTKNPAILGVDKGLVAPNYLLVYSANEKTKWNVKMGDFLAGGGKVVVVTNRKRHAPIDQWSYWKVVDGDVTDDLWTHPEGAIIDLTAKGSARKLGEGFVKHVYSTTADK